MNRILLLPAEIRNRIYLFCLKDSEEIVVIDNHLGQQKQPALLQSCAQIRREALQLFYANNKFTAIIKDNSSARLLVKWLNAVGSACASVIPHLDVIVDSDDWVEAYISNPLDPSSKIITWDAMLEAMVNSNIPRSAPSIHVPKDLETRIATDWSKRPLTENGVNDLDAWLTLIMAETVISQLRRTLEMLYSVNNAQQIHVEEEVI